MPPPLQVAIWTATQSVQLGVHTSLALLLDSDVSVEEFCKRTGCLYWRVLKPWDPFYSFGTGEATNFNFCKRNDGHKVINEVGLGDRSVCQTQIVSARLTDGLFVFQEVQQSGRVG